MTLSPGTRFAAYEVVGLLGVGGMGEVYRARDATLRREVALKILPDVFQRDADRCARFEREAQILASLSHPAIGVIYGIAETEAAGGEPGARTRALVLELVEGPTLGDLIAAGPIEIEQALDIARQIAEALEAAHQRGVVHRDLKPANVKVRPDGVVKVLDFGLAKALESPDERTTSAAQTLMSPALTEVGVLFGTAAYMSPEQARGRPADNRSDVWSFGCVLFEMLSGKRPFDGEETSDVLAAILRAEPDWSALPASTPAAVRRLLRRCLVKDRARRLRDIGDARLELEDAHAAAESSGALAAHHRRERIAWAGALALVLVTSLAAGRWLASDEAPLQEMRLELGGRETSTPESFALSPDGRSIVFSADGEQGPQLWLRRLSASAPQPLPGTQDGRYPFWSPDSRSIGFFTLSSLKRVDIDGGQPQTLAATVTPAGGSWSADGTIIYVPNNSGGVFAIPASGGPSRRVTPPLTPTLATQHPHFLPDGRNFLFYVAREDESGGVYLGSTQSEEVRRLFGADTPAVYEAGHLWFAHQDTLFAQRFDLATFELRGQIVRVADGVRAEPRTAAVSVSAAGPVAYRSTLTTRELVWFDREGRRLDAIATSGDVLANPSLSPDGRRLLVQQTVRQNVDVWVIDVERSVFTRVTTDPAIDSMPVWAPDGRRFVANAAGRALAEGASAGGQARDGALDIRQLDSADAGEELVAFGGTVKIASDWSPDGRHVLFKQMDVATGTWDVWAVPVDERSNPLRLTSTAYDERDAQFSPDGQWIAFESNESGAWEIYVQPFPGTGAKQRVSTRGGHQVRWRADGAELFYVAADGTLTAVPVERAEGRVDFGAPVPLFHTRLPPRSAISRQQYVVSANGQRFLLIAAAVEPAPINLLLNWAAPTAR